MKMRSFSFKTRHNGLSYHLKKKNVYFAKEK
jgi:hypothetical protein